VPLTRQGGKKTECIVAYPLQQWSRERAIKTFRLVHGHIWVLKGE